MRKLNCVLISVMCDIYTLTHMDVYIQITCLSHVAEKYLTNMLHLDIKI